MRFRGRIVPPTHAHRRSAGQAGRPHGSLRRPGGEFRRSPFDRSIPHGCLHCKHREAPAARNRDPTRDRACTPYLEEQIRIVGPEVIVTLGRHSSRYILSYLSVEFDRITDIRGTVYSCSLFGHPVRLIPTLHPAAALYNPAYREALEEDFRIVGRELAKAGGSPAEG